MQDLFASQEFLQYILISEGEESPKPSSSKSTTQSTSCLDCAKIYKKVKELEKSVAAVHYYCETISKSVEKLASNSTEFASPATFSNKRPATKEDPVKAGLRQRIEVKRESQTVCKNHARKHRFI